MKSFYKRLFIIFLLIVILFSTNITFAVDNEPNLQSRAAILMDNKTNKILYDKNSNERMFPASTTKIVTAILALENCNLDDTVTASYDAIMSIPEGYVMANIDGGEQLTVEQLLQLLLVHSANDAANVLAEYVGGSIESFVSMMNTKVNELGLNDTHFTNTYGLQDENHYTTAHDLAIIMQYCMKNDDFRKIAGSASCSIPATNKSDVRSYVSTNELLVPNSPNYYSYVTMGKTGFTTEAGDCLVSCAYKNDLELICVVLGGTKINGVSTRFTESKLLYEYGFNNFSIKNIVNTGDIITQIKVKNGSPDTQNLDLAFENDISALVKNSEFDTNLLPDIFINDNISAPISKGDVLGSAVYTIDDVKYETNLVATHNVEKSKLPDFIIKIILVMIMLIGTYLIFFTNRRKKQQIETNNIDAEISKEAEDDN